MTLEAEGLRARAKRRYARIARGRQDPRYPRVLGRFKAAGLLSTNYEVPLHRNPVTISDALWAGELEPRILELLPALVVKKPSLFVDPTNLPRDLSIAVRSLRRGDLPEAFRGIPGPDLLKWLPRVGHRGKTPSRSKCFRLTAEDLSLLEELSRDRGLSETDTMRQGLRALARIKDAELGTVPHRSRREK
jgi:hypothetical protein